MCAELRAAYPDMDFNHDDTLAEGDRVMIRWTMHATHNGPLMDIPATGKRVTVTGIDVFRIAGGQIVNYGSTGINWACCSSLA